MAYATSFGVYPTLDWVAEVRGNPLLSASLAR